MAQPFSKRLYPKWSLRRRDEKSDISVLTVANDEKRVMPGTSPAKSIKKHLQGELYFGCFENSRAQTWIVLGLFASL